ncbi:MAG TPA: HD domain-containing protein [Nitrospiria bacterium]|nr:HD domain-containing protein [Nitrospiria bacterium]
MTASVERTIADGWAAFQAGPVGALLGELASGGGDWYLVGGAVRDLALERPTKDIDLVVRGLPIDRVRAALERHGRVDLVGKHFGVLKFLPREVEVAEAIDVALPRTEHSLHHTGGYKDFAVQSDPTLPIEEDLRRRDFTVNAMAWEIARGRLLDPFNGGEDLTARRLRAVGKPAERFAEDYSRLLRGLRLACQLGFEIDPETWRALGRAVGRLNDRTGGGDDDFIVPRETIGKELIRMFACAPVRAFDLLDGCGAAAVLMPELLPMKNCPQPPNYHSEGDVWIHTRLALSQLDSDRFREEFPGEPPTAELVFAVLLHDVAKPVTLRTPERDGTDRIRFDGHDRVGAAIAHAIAVRLKLSSFPADSHLHVDADRLAWLVAHHLLTMSGPIDQMKNSTMERYFFSDDRPGRTLQQLIWTDSSATIHESGRADMTSYGQLKARIAQLEALTAERRRLPPPLIDGHTVMRLLSLPPGPNVGRLLTTVREAQLAGAITTPDEAVAFLRSQDVSTTPSHTDPGGRRG